MKKYFLYELKKHLWTLVILTAVCALPYIINAASFEMYWTWYPEYNGLEGDAERVINDPQLSFVFWELIFLLFIVPTIMYSFKMSKRGVDGYYALPLKKEKLYFVSTMVGLILVLVPFTVSYWGGFLALLVRPDNPYKMVYYLPTYFAGVCFAIFLYGINAFVFTRANRTSDGVIFMLAYAFVGMLAYEYVNSLFRDYWGYMSYAIQSAFVFGGGMLEFVEEMSSKIAGNEGDLYYAGLWFATSIGFGVVGYALLFYLLRFEKGENAEQNSDSAFGYMALIPVYLALGIGLGGEEILGMIFMLIAAFVATIVHKRTFRLKWKDLLPLGGGFAAGIVLMLIAL